MLYLCGRFTKQQQINGAATRNSGKKVMIGSKFFNTKEDALSFLWGKGYRRLQCYYNEDWHIQLLKHIDTNETAIFHYHKQREGDVYMVNGYPNEYDGLLKFTQRVQDILTKLSDTLKVGGHLY